MKKLFASLGVFLGTFVALTSTNMCWTILFDEADTPESLIR